MRTPASNFGIPVILFAFALNLLTGSLLLKGAETVSLLDDATFSIKRGGRTVGNAVLPRGSQVQMVEEQGQRVLLRRDTFEALLPRALVRLANEPEAQSAASTWQLEHEIILSDRDAAGKIVHRKNVPAGTPVTLLRREASDGRQELWLWYSGREIIMPTGESLQTALGLMHPGLEAGSATPFDVDAWQEMRQHPVEVARWIPQQSGPRKGQSGRWDERGFFVVKKAVPPPQTPEFDAIPEDFSWDRSVAVPGKFAFLALPWIKQANPGICVAAAGINVVRYLRPEIQLSGPEFFRMLNAREGGASDRELSRASFLLGLPSSAIPANARSGRTPLVDFIKRKLEEGYPVCAADKQHMVLITGYDSSRSKLFVWNQWGNGKVINGMPKGHYELNESDLGAEFKYVMVFESVEFQPASNVAALLQQIAGPMEDLQIHPLVVGGGARQSDAYLAHAGTSRLKAVLRSGRTILCPRGATVLSIQPSSAESDDAMVECISRPSGAKTIVPLRTVAAEIARLDSGNFYSGKLGGPQSVKKAVQNAAAQPTVSTP